MPAARGTKRAASKTASSVASAASSTAPKNKKKRGVVQLEIPKLPCNKGRVFTCGQGDVGQLGLGEDVTESTKFRHVAALGDKIVAVSAGGMHTIALDSTGKVWTYGCNDEGALGRNTASDTDEGTPKKVTLPAKAVAVTAGDSHSAALLENGDVYAWGSFRDSHGSMGLVMQGREGKASKEPIKIDIGETAADIASGGDHLVILTCTGSVFTMGCGEQGQLGRLSQRSASRDARHGFSALLVPGRVTLKAGAARVWAGYHATFVHDANLDKVFAFGLNNYGQLGITGEKRKTAIYGPIECDAFRVSSGWSRVAPGQHHSIALDRAGQVYAVGRVEYGRLGLGERTGDAETLVPVPKLENKKCISVAAGTSSSFAVTETGEVYGWGMGSEGQLGTGQCADADSPAAAVLAPPAPAAPRAVAAGGQHTVLLLEDPNPQKESSPAPETETAEQKTEATTEDDEEVEDIEDEKPRPKRQKKEQEGEVTSTSASEAEENKPQKLNGDEKKIAPMDVDQTDNTESSQDTLQDTSQDNSQDNSQDTPLDTVDTPEPTKEEPEKMDTETEPEKPETTDTSSQGTTDSETRSQDGQDAEIKDAEKPEVNGTEEKPEIKSVEVTSNPLVTTA